MFSRETYLKRRKKLIASCANKGIILLTGNSNSPINYKANVYQFRQDSNFLYFTGIDLPGLNATIDTSTGNTILYGDNISTDELIWTGEQISIQEWAFNSGIDEVKPAGQLIKDLAGEQQILYTPPYRDEKKIFLSRILERDISDIDKGFSSELVEAIVSQRSIKSSEEIVQIENAINNTTLEFQVGAMKMAMPGEYECRIAAYIEETILRKKSRPAYRTICTVRGEILHNTSYEGKLEKGKLLLVDAGAESTRHYASDITRTTPVGGRFSNKQREVYEIVLKAQLEAIKGIRIGTEFKKIHLVAAKVITSGLISLGIMRGDEDEIVSKGAYALFFPHGLGHMLGLDVHDMEDLGEDYVGYDQNTKRDKTFGISNLRLGRKLQSGFVLTVEPGIYFIPSLIEKWKQENKFAQYIDYQVVEGYSELGGIRIEDNIHLTDNGPEIIGDPIPKSINEIEALF